MKGDGRTIAAEKSAGTRNAVSASASSNRRTHGSFESTSLAALERSGAAFAFAGTLPFRRLLVALGNRRHNLARCRANLGWCDHLRLRAPAQRPSHEFRGVGNLVC